MTYRVTALVLTMVFSLQFGSRPARAQANLTETDSETTVSKISFKFGTTQSYTPIRLSEEIATTAPGFLYGVLKFLSFLPFFNVETHTLGPIELQRDVLRLERFYSRQGFLHTDINFFASQFDLGKNRVHVIFSIREGPPLLVKNLTIQGMDNLPDPIDKQWLQLKRKIVFPDSGRYSEFESLRIQNKIVTFLQNGGFPFARITSSPRIDSTANEVFAMYSVVTETRARVSEIIIEGNESVDDYIVTRELPFSTGEYFSRKKLSEGQRDIFEMNLFRFAIAELPEQPADSTLTVRYRLGEANRRSLTLSSGYSREFGIAFDGSLTHRNFLGGARAATFSAIMETGWLSDPGNGKTERRTTNLSFSIRQPFVFRRGLSVTVSPFYNRVDDPNQNTDLYSLGATGTLLWRVLKYRNATLEFTTSKSVPLSGRGTDEPFDLYNVNSGAVGLTIGKLDDYLNPTRGLMINPVFELSGVLLVSGVNYRKASVSGRFYVPVSRRSSFALRAVYGLMVPFGISKDQTDPETEFRFDSIRFYSGGSNDTRGWAFKEIGPQIAVGDSIFFDENGTAQVRNPLYEAVGGQAKLSGSIEYRFPVPSLPDAFRLGVFLDMGVLSARFTKNAETVSIEKTTAFIEDSGRLRGSTAQFGTGGGFRYATAVGSIRFDVAYKLTPSFTDLRNPEDIILFREGFTDIAPEPKNSRRWRIHVSLDRSF